MKPVFARKVTLNFECIIQFQETNFYLKVNIVKTRKNVCSIVDVYPYPHFEDKFCKTGPGGGPVQFYPTLQAAKSACSDNFACNCIEDLNCDGNSWSTHEYASIPTSSEGTCAWTKW